MTTALRGPKSVADLSAGTIVATVELAASPERVFDALTTDEVTRWWGDESMYRTTKWTADVRTGGRWRADGVGADGTPFFVHGEYVAVDRPSKLVLTWLPAWDGERPTRLTYVLESIAAGTRLTVRHDGFGEDGRESCASHGEGWELVLGWLARHLQPAHDAQAQRYYMFRLIGPRPTFPADMTPKEREAMQAHAQYWREKLAAGTAVVFGPVADPQGVWGLAVARVASEPEAIALRDGDPAITSGIGMRFEMLPMVTAVART